MSTNRILQSVTASNSVTTHDLNVSGNVNLKGIKILTPKVASTPTKILIASPGCIIAPSTTLSDLTLIFPSKPNDGQIIYLSFTQDIKKVQFENGNFANKSTLGGNIIAGDTLQLLYNQESNKWYKIGGSSTANVKSEHD